MPERSWMRPGVWIGVGLVFFGLGLFLDWRLGWVGWAAVLVGIVLTLLNQLKRARDAN